MRILVVEDEPTLSSQLVDALKAAGYVPETAFDGVEAAYLGKEEPFDAIVLDLGLPRLDGLSVLQGWRSSGVTTPVLILTARDSWHEKVAGIDAGADDYLSKPFHMPELLARLRALIRRSHGHASPVLSCGPVTLDTRSQQVSAHGVPIVLTSHEYKVLSCLMHHQGEVVSRTDLTEHIYAQEADRDSNTIDVFIARLRRKLPEGVIDTVRGQGYRMVKESA